MSNLVMVNMARVICSAFEPSRIISKNRMGTTCQDTPDLSVGQPQTLGTPPSAEDSRRQLKIEVQSQSASPARLSNHGHVVSVVMTV